MRTILLLILVGFSISASAQSINLPPPTGFVSDFEDLFTPQQEDSLRVAIESYERKTTNEIVIVTLPASIIQSADINDYTLALLRNWGVGKKGKNNGILIGISATRRTIRIQNGYGIEKKLSDNETKKIIEEDFIPLFKGGKYFEGTYKGLMTIMKKVPAM